MKADLAIPSEPMDRDEVHGGANPRSLSAAIRSSRLTPKLGRTRTAYRCHACLPDMGRNGYVSPGMSTMSESYSAAVSARRSWVDSNRRSWARPRAAWTSVMFALSPSSSTSYRQPAPGR